jgi:NADPH:quinone reductase-like Zn-dependent oxidoreductase
MERSHEMKAALVTEAGATPVCGVFAEPVAGPGENRIAVSAAAISHATRGRASGKHYSSRNVYPLIPGIDGVGRLADGQRVYFAGPREPFGGMAEVAVAPAAMCVPVPDDVDDVTAAAIANPGMSSWAALELRAGLQPGQTVLVNGATGIAGRLAVQIARYLGAGRVIATGRDAAALERAAALGADSTISLLQEADALEDALKTEFARGVDVVIDYLWGRSAEQLLVAGAKVGPEGRAIRFVQVGSAGGEDITLPGAVLRGSAIQLMGSGIGSVSLDGLVATVRKLFAATAPAGFMIDTTAVPLSQVDEAWNAAGATRTVLVMG